MNADLFGPPAAPPAKQPSAAVRKVMESYERNPAVLRVDCPRDYCRAVPGEPCRSAGGNVTLPHVSRVTASEGAGAA